ncbi:MAG TPA: L-histidine N(alpha)-methyltransferase, partial [Thermoanaerobaculia bacterium]
MTVETASTSARFTLHQTSLPAAGFAADVKQGLSAARKAIPPHHFYDELGSALFAAICELPEYYVTRAETDVFHVYAEEIVSVIGTPSRIVELGPGNARKTRLLLDRLASPVEYVPLDVDAAMLEVMGRQLIAEYPRLTVSAVCGDFRRPSRAIGALPAAEGRTVVLFLGSSIGNLEHDPAVALLRDLRSALVPGDAILLGADLRKPKAILEPAYDDALGVTAAFNLNLLQRINRELGGHFDLRSFAHRAFYDERL